MKKIYLTLTLMAFVSLIFAQKDFSIEKQFNNVSFSTDKTPTDTLMPDGFATGTPTLYSSGGGYVCGTNNYGDLAKAQGYMVTTGYIVEGVGFWVGAKEVVGSAGTVTVNCYASDGNGTSASGAVTTAPGTILGSVTRTMDVVDTAQFDFYTFPTPITVTNTYYLGMDFSQIGNDTIGLVSTADGEGGSMEMTWEKWSDGTWYSLLGAWPLDIDMAVFAVINNASANINDNYFINGMKLSQNQPNPVNNSTIVEYEIENSSDVTLEIIDLNGRLVYTSAEGNKNAGLHSITIDTEKIASGTYYYSLKANGQRLTKKMVIIK